MRDWTDLRGERRDSPSPSLFLLYFTPGLITLSAHALSHPSFPSPPLQNDPSLDQSLITERLRGIILLSLSLSILSLFYLPPAFCIPFCLILPPLLCFHPWFFNPLPLPSSFSSSSHPLYPVVITLPAFPSSPLFLCWRPSRMLCDQLLQLVQPQAVYHVSPFHITGFEWRLEITHSFGMHLSVTKWEVFLFFYSKYKCKSKVSGQWLRINFEISTNNNL